MTKYEVAVLEKQLQDVVDQIDLLKDELVNLEHKLHVYDNARILLNLAKTSKIKNKKDFILYIINTAIQDIFESDIEIKIISTDEDDSLVGKSKNIKIKYDLVLYENGIEIGRNEKLLTSNGGGILSVVSFLLKILTGFIYSENKFYVFDEALSQVSEKFQERLSLFIRNFCERYGFTILLITHNPKLSEHSHIDYTFGNIAKPSEKLKELAILYKNINGISLENNYYYLKIKNFQSIKNIDVKLKGFVTISGVNNIGKSALVRAINSVIYNNFQESYLRLGEKKSEIIFGKIENNEDRWVKVIFQNKKISYHFWDGQKYTGKKLAQDKIAEHLQAIGFKQINVSSMYKNWRSNVKDQVERVYITTQYDSLYVVGSKSNDNDKLFNFLFNAEAIATAIININYDIREMQMRFNELQTQVTDLEYRKEIMQLKFSIAKKRYLANLIKEVEDVKKRYKLLKRIWLEGKQLSESISSKISKFILINDYSRLKRDVALSTLAHRYILTMTDLSKSIVEKLEKIQNLKIVVYNIYNVKSTITTLKNKKLAIDNTLDILNTLLDRLKNANDIKNIITKINTLTDQYNTLQINFQNKKIEMDSLLNQFNLVQCGCCQGLGYHLKKESS